MFILLALIISAAPAVYAQVQYDTPQINAQAAAIDAAATGQSAGTVGAAITAAATKQSAAAANGGSTLSANPSLGADTASQYGAVMTWIMKLFAWLLGVAALTLDYAVYYTVVTMGNYVHNLTAVGVAWRILRDIGNIMLIFGFLAVGITTILNVNWYGGGTKMLPMLIVAAVFLNFSLFITEAVIDTGNLFATQFFTQINGGSLPTVGPSGLSAGGVVLTTANEGISNRIMGQLGLQNIYNAANTNSQILQGGYSWIIGFMGIILFLVAAFVMFSLAFVLIARFVALIFLIILAPVGFAGLAVPMLARRAKQWWDKLFEQTITAPVLLLMLYIALAVITDAQFLKGFGVKGGSSSAAGFWTGFFQVTTGATNLAGFGAMLLSFLVAMGLLIAVVIQSKNLSAFGAAGASKLAGKLTFGATAWGVNRTLGRGAYFASRGLRHSEKFNKINAMTGRVMSGTLDRVATASFDVRGATIGGGLKGLGIEAGAAQKDGFVGARKQNIKAHEEEAKRIEEAHKEAFKETPEELETIARATREQDEAERARDGIQKEKDSANERISRYKDEIKRLTEISKADTDAGRPSSVAKSIEVAQQNLKDSNVDLTRATSKFAAAEIVFAKMKAKKIKVEKAPDERMKASIKAGKQAYAEGIDHLLNPITFVAYGPDTAAAARKIIREANKKKSSREELADWAKKVIAEEEAEKKSPAGEAAEEKKREPETSTKPEVAKP